MRTSNDIPKIPIWGETIPYNTPKSKLEDMEISKFSNFLSRYLSFFTSIGGQNYKDSRQKIDTYTYYNEIKAGFAKETYEDVPYIQPYLVDGSDKAVLVVPGGGFSFKQTDIDGSGRQAEGDLIAHHLNQAGINAFVLWYRTNPYEMPIPLKDMQRAVRFIKYHAKEYGIDPNKLGAMGFSGGGYEVAGLINLLKDSREFPETYQMDAVDQVDARLVNAGLIYPALGFEYLMPLLNATFLRQRVDTEEKRQALVEQFSCIKQFSSADVPQFLCYGSTDTLTPPAQMDEYIEKLEASQADYQVCYLKGAFHGYGANPTLMKKYGHWITEYIAWYNAHISS